MSDEKVETVTANIFSEVVSALPEGFLNRWLSKLVAALRPTPSEPKPQIIVADKGFVFLGVVTDHNDGTGWVTIHNCLNLRQWGTTLGLGQLSSGPTDKTMADPWGTVTTVPIIRVEVDIDAQGNNYGNWRDRLFPKDPAKK